MKKRANEDVRQMEKKFGVPQWQIADRLGISECTLVKRMRFELPPEQKAEIRRIIDGLKEG